MKSNKLEKGAEKRKLQEMCEEMPRAWEEGTYNSSKFFERRSASQKNKTQMLVLQSPTGACNYWYLPPPRKKIAKNQNSTGKSPNCNYIKAPKSAADGKILKVFRHDWLGHWRAGVPSTAGGECKLLWLWRTKPFEELFGKGGGGGLALFLGFCNYYVNSRCNFLSFLVFCCPRLVSFAQPTLSFTQFFSILFPTPSWFPN